MNTALLNQKTLREVNTARAIASAIGASPNRVGTVSGTPQHQGDIAAFDVTVGEPGRIRQYRIFVVEIGE